MITEIRFPAGHANAGQFDFRAMANALVKEKGYSWSIACLEIKRNYPASQEFFGLPAEK